MTQPYLDTATLIRKLTEDLEASKAQCAQQERVAKLKFDAIAGERDCQKRMANESDVLLHKTLSDRDDARHTIVRLTSDYERLQASYRLEQSQAAGWLRSLNEARQERDNAIANSVVIERGRDQAREQLAKLEWSSIRRPDSGGPLSTCCPICQGVKPGHEVGSAFKREQVGHQSDCWFAKSAHFPFAAMGE